MGDLSEASGVPDPPTRSPPRTRRPSVVVLVARDIDNPTRAGGDRHVCLLGEALAGRGCDVTILCSSSDRLPRVSERNGTKVERIAPLRVLPIAVWVRLICDSRTGSDLVLEDMIGATRVPFLAPLFPRRKILGFWFQDNSGFFHTHYSGFLTSLAAVAQRVVLGVHRRCIVVCPSQTSRAWLLKRGFSPGRVGVFYPSADPENRADARAAFSDRRNRIITIGNIRRVKRFGEAIKTLAILRRSVPDADLVILGRNDDGSYLEELRSQARDAGLEEEVHFEIGVSEQRKYDLLARAKVLTIHSATEGFALTVTEAGLSGVPAVTNSSVPPEAYRPGETGILVPSDSPEAFASAIRPLLENGQLWQRFSKSTQELSLQFKSTRADPTLTRMLAEILGPLPSPATGGATVT